MALIRWRIGLLAAIGIVIGLVAGGIFDQLELSLVLPPVLVGVAGLATAGRGRWWWHGSLWLAAIGSVVVAVLLVDGSLSDASSGLWSGPRRLLTTEWPSPVDPAAIGAMAALLAIATAVAIELSVVERWNLLPLLPMGVAFVVAVALGAPRRPDWWLIAAIGLLAATFALARHDADDRPFRRPATRDRTLIATGLAVVAASLLTSGALAWADRADPRRTEDASSSAALLDPIEATVALRQAEPPLDLYVIDDQSTLISASLPSRWRTAALDTYDGQRWVPRLTLRPIGSRLGLPSSTSPEQPPPIRYDLTLLTDDLDLLPFPGRPISVDTPVETDTDRVAVRLRERPTPGQVVRAESEVAPQVQSIVSAVVATRQVDEIAGTFTSRARSIAGRGTVLDQIRAIEEVMRTEWQLDSSAPGGGQQLALIERFVAETQRGTREQFVTAFVLLVRSLGFDARVAVGFIVEPDQLSSPLAIDSSRAMVWPEVRLDVGWTAFDPVPAVEAIDEDVPPPPPDAQSPAAAQPPIAPPADAGDELDETVVDIDQGDDRWGAVRAVVVRTAAIAGIAALPIVGVIVAILVVKWRRRRRRLTAEQPWMRVRGAWANTTDSLVDAGLDIEPSWTDDRIAGSATGLAPGSPHEMRRLASMATAVTFGPTDGAGHIADDAVLTSSAVDAAIRADRTRLQRISWRLSLRSLRRSTRSPVRV